MSNYMIKSRILNYIDDFIEDSIKRTAILGPVWQRVDKHLFANEAEHL